MSEVPLYSCSAAGSAFPSLACSASREDSGFRVQGSGSVAGVLGVQRQPLAPSPCTPTPFPIPRAPSPKTQNTINLFKDEESYEKVPLSLPLPFSHSLARPLSASLVSLSLSPSLSLSLSLFLSRRLACCAPRASGHTPGPRTHRLSTHPDPTTSNPQNFWV